MMPNPTLMIVPVDGRPVTREQVIQTAAIADCQLFCPDKHQLGYFREPANRDALHDWVLTNAHSVDGFIFSLDMLVYGGLVPSRFIDDPLPKLLEYLQLLRVLKSRYPQKPVYGFVATMRISNNNENEEEKHYWQEYGTLMWQWSFHQDRFDCRGEPQDDAQAKQAQSQIPESVRIDYLDTRARNFALTSAIIDLVKNGIIDRLILPQDDTAEYGFNIAERRKLQDICEQHQLTDKVLIYPGADEVIYTLLSHLWYQITQTPGINIALNFHQPETIGKLIARYEDRPLTESLRQQIIASGNQLVDENQHADVVIAVHTQGTTQGEWALGYPLVEPSKIDANWLSTLAVEDKPLAVLDLAYANGGDPVFIDALVALRPLKSLVAYSAWNTASNSIGSLMAQVSFALSKDTNHNANQFLLCTRLLDDYLYQAIIRQQVRKYRQQQSHKLPLEQEVKRFFVNVANQFINTHEFAHLQLADCYLPWQRTFEIGLALTEQDKDVNCAAD